MPRFELALSGQSLVVIAATLLAASVAFLYYRTTLPRLALSRRIPLALLRTTTLCLLALLVFQPLLRLLVASTEPPVLAVLVDDSRSMQLSDRMGSRAAMLRSLLAGEPLRMLDRHATLRYFTFGARPRPVETLPPDSLRLDENATDIASAIRELQVLKERQNLRAVLLLTDGSYTVGQNPVYDAERLGIPVYAIGIGDSADPKDLSVSHVTANDIVYMGLQTPVNVIVKSSGFSGERVEVTLAEGSRELDRKTILLRTGTLEYPVRLSYEPDSTGTEKLTVKVSSLPDEVSAANNQQRFFVRVLKTKLNVLLLSGVPSPDDAIIRQTLAEQPNLSVSAFTQKKDGSFHEGILSAARADSADCLVLIHLPTSATTTSTLDRVRHLLVERNLPVLFIDGKGVDLSRLGAFVARLPFTIVGPAGSEESVTVKPENSQRGNPLLELATEQGFDGWSRLPPIFRRGGAYRPRPEATVLATCVVHNVPTQEPLLLARSVGRQRSLAVTAYGLWRWRLMAQGDDATQHHLEEFLRGAIRWLTTPDDTRQFTVTPSKEFFSQGEPVEFEGQLYDASAQPVDEARVRLILRKGNQVAETGLRAIGNGRYEGMIDGLDEGDYVFNATAEWRGKTLGEESGKFSVGGMDLEFRDVRMNIEILRQLGYRTGGQYVAPENVARIDSLLRANPSYVPRDRTTAAELELWHWQYLLALLILLLATEWLLRKWHGML